MNDYPIPPDFTGLIRNMQKSIDRLERRPTTSTNAVVSGRGDVQMVTDGSGIPLPSVPPAVSPVLKAYGNADSITLVVDDPNVAQTTFLDYFIDGVLITSTQSRVVLVQHNSTGGPLLDATNYTFDVQARNVAGSAAPSAPVVAQLNPDVDQTTVLGWVVAGFILAGSIQVGNITIDPDTGITIPLASGGVIQFPSDGSTAVIQAVLRTADLVVNGGLTVNGSTNVVNGSVQWPGTVGPPINAPTILNVPHPTVVSAATTTISGAVQVPSTNKVLTLDQGAGSLYAYDLTTGALTNTLAYTVPTNTVGSGFAPVPVGLCIVGTRYYMTWLMQKWTTTTDAVIFVPFDWNGTASTITQFAQVTSVSVATSTGNPGITSAIGDDTKTSIHVQIGSTIYNCTASTGATIGTLALTGWSSVYSTLCFVGTGPYGASVFQMKSGATWDSTGNINSTYSFRTPTNTYSGWILWNGTSRIYVGNTTSGVVFATLSSFMNTFIYVAVSYFDSDTSGTTGGTPVGGSPGQHETTKGSTYSFSVAGGTWVKVQVPIPPDQGNPDDPDQTRVYIGTVSGTLYKQPDLGVGVYSATYGSLATGTKVPETVNGFTAVSSNSRAYSGALNALSAPVWLLTGAGAGNVGPLAWDSAGVQTSKPHAACIVATAAQGMSTGVETTMTLGSVRYDTTGSAMTGTANSITIVQAGLYRIRLVSSYATTTAGGARITLLYKNATALERWGYPVTSAATPAFGTSETTEFQLAAGDVITYRQFQSAVATLNTGFASTYIPALSVQWVSP